MSQAEGPENPRRTLPLDHGGIQKRFNKLVTEKNEEFIAFPEVKDTVLELHDLYKKALRELREASYINPDRDENPKKRRLVARSDDQNSMIFRKVALMEKEIEAKEKLLEVVKEKYLKELEKITASKVMAKKLAKAIGQASKWKYYASSGDYFAILCQEVRDHEAFEIGIETRYKTVSDLMEQFQLEEKQDANGKNETPIHDAIVKVHKFLEDTFETPEEIIEVLKEYAERNKQMHCGAKALADAGNFSAFHAMLVKYKKDLPNQSYEPEYEVKFAKVLRQVERQFFLFSENHGFILTFKAAQRYQQYAASVNPTFIPKILSRAEVRHLNRQSESREGSAMKELAATKKYSKMGGYDVLKLLILKQIPMDSPELSEIVDKIDDLRLEVGNVQKNQTELEEDLEVERARNAELEKKCDKVITSAKERTAKLKAELEMEETKAKNFDRELYRLKKKFKVPL